MKYKKKCPKCGSQDIVMFLDDGCPDNAHKGIMTGMTLFSNVSMERYICCNCGFTEQWVDPRSSQILKESRKAKQIG